MTAVQEYQLFSTEFYSDAGEDENGSVLTRSDPQFLECETDGSLVALSVLGDTDAFGVLVHRYQSDMRRHALRTLGSSSEADDVVQESLISAWDKLATLNKPEQVKSWLMRVVRNKSIDRLRMSSHYKDVMLDDNLPAPERLRPHAVITEALQLEALELALANLPINQKRAWLLRELSDHTYTEIAAELDVPDSTVRGLLSRARQTLAHEMASWQ